VVAAELKTAILSDETKNTAEINPLKKDIQQ